MPELSRFLQPRHITVISSGAISGAGLMVGSSASIGAAGPPIVVSYLIRAARAMAAALISPGADRP